jgi:hypothetical protein
MHPVLLKHYTHTGWFVFVIPDGCQLVLLNYAQSLKIFHVSTATVCLNIPGKMQQIRLGRK